MNESAILTLRDNARHELLQIKTVEAGITHLNKLKSIETWVKAEKKDAELQNIVAEQKLRTQRILGELLKEREKNTGAMGIGTNQHKEVRLPDVTAPTLEDIGISKRQSSNFQKIASIPNDEFEAFIAEKKQAVNDAVGELTTAGALRLASGITQTYNEKNRLVGYFNDKYARLMRAYAHDKGMDVSDVVVLGGRTFIDSLLDDEKARMLKVYLSDVTFGEAK